MKELIDKIRYFLKGYEKVGEHQRPKTLWKYLIYYPLNWICLISCSFFIVLFIKGGIKYESPLIWTSALFPVIILIYNFADEYYAFQWYRTGRRKISAKNLQDSAKFCVTVVLLYLIIRTFITG